MELRLGAVKLSAPQGNNLRLRIASSVILAPIALGTVYLGGIPFAVLITLVTGIGLFEWLRLINPKLPMPIAVFAYGSLVLSMLLGFRQSVECGLASLAIFTVVLFLAVLASPQKAEPKRPLGIALGLPYMAGSGLALLYLRGLPESGRALVVYLLIVVWSTDTGAYIAGRAIGGPKLAPTISPKKTWAGLFGGMALAACLGYGVAWASGSRLGFAGPWSAAGFAVLMAVVAQAGDFFKSFFKRRAGVKDSGHIIPGHGGVLDRIDGLVFAAVFLALVEYWVESF